MIYLLTVTVSGGVLPYTWNWSTGDTSQDLGQSREIES